MKGSEVTETSTMAWLELVFAFPAYCMLKAALIGRRDVQGLQVLPGHDDFVVE